MSKVLGSLQILMLEVEGTRERSEPGEQEGHCQAPIPLEQSFQMLFFMMTARALLPEARRRGNTCYSSQHAGLATARGTNYEQGVASL